MAREFTPHDKAAPELPLRSVVAFFEQRAKKAASLGPVRAVLYQDKHPDLAERRDQVEKERLLPLLQLDGSQRILDIGCGAGRWAALVASCSLTYHGVDVSPAMIRLARELVTSDGVRFSVVSASDLSAAALEDDAPFDRVMCFGVTIYLNDEDVRRLFAGIREVCSMGARVLLREPVATGSRLTLSEHYSDEMEQVYHATYRTEEQLLTFISEGAKGAFALRASGDVYTDELLNNRTETRQRYYIFERAS